MIKEIHGEAALSVAINLTLPPSYLEKFLKIAKIGQNISYLGYSISDIGKHLEAN